MMPCGFMSQTAPAPALSFLLRRRVATEMAVWESVDNPPTSDHAGTDILSPDKEITFSTPNAAVYRSTRPSPMPPPCVMDHSQRLRHRTC
jgi:hypothetical protein